MKPFWQNDLNNKITLTGFLKLCADVILINLSVLTSLVFRLLWIIAYAPEANIDYKLTLWNYWHIYNDSAWLLSIICVVSFFLNGFLYGRSPLHRAL